MRMQKIALLALALCSGTVGPLKAQLRGATRLPTVPALRPFADQPRQYVLVEPFKYVSRRGGEPITVPAGFVTDFASIPGLVQPAFGPSVHDLPALVHDYLYWRHACTRAQADEIFYRALDEFGVSRPGIMFIQMGLAIGGPRAYRKNERERRQQLPRIIPESARTIPVTTWAEYRRQLRQRKTPLDPPDRKPPPYCSAG